MELSQKNEACIKRLQILENEGAHVEEHVRGKISSSMSVMSAETAGTAGSVQSNSTWNSIFRAYGWKVQRDEEPPAEHAKFVLRPVKEQELCGIGGHCDPKMEDSQLEKLDLVPSILDGNTKVPAWLAQDSLPAFFTSRLRNRSDEEAEKDDALITLIEERREKYEMR